MGKMTYQDFINFEARAGKEYYYYTHKMSKDKSDEENLKYYKEVLKKIQDIKKAALQNYLSINDLRFTD